MRRARRSALRELHGVTRVRGARACAGLPTAAMTRAPAGLVGAERSAVCMPARASDSGTCKRVRDAEQELDIHRELMVRDPLGAKHPLPHRCAETRHAFECLEDLVRNADR